MYLLVGVFPMIILVPFPPPARTCLSTGIVYLSFSSLFHAGLKPKAFFFSLHAPQDPPSLAIGFFNFIVFQFLFAMNYSVKPYTFIVPCTHRSFSPIVCGLNLRLFSLLSFLQYCNEFPSFSTHQRSPPLSGSGSVIVSLHPLPNTAIPLSSHDSLVIPQFIPKLLQGLVPLTTLNPRQIVPPFPSPHNEHHP